MRSDLQLVAAALHGESARLLRLANSRKLLGDSQKATRAVLRAESKRMHTLGIDYERQANDARLSNGYPVKVEHPTITTLQGTF